MDKKNHWEKVYTTKQPNEVSWTQEVPKSSLDFIDNFNLPKDASIIDIGGGDSNLVDHLIEAGYTNVSVLDISQSALDRAKKRLGDKAKQVTWIASDITEFKPSASYDLWHDRATFHFLTQEKEIQYYTDIATDAISKYMVIGTFSLDGPQKCSGLEIKQYSEESLQQTLTKSFEKIRCKDEVHVTPFQTEQKFVFCSFKKKSN